MQDNHLKYIEVNPEKRFGKPILIGTRIAVQDVKDWLNSGMSVEEIISDFPELTADQIEACLVYANNKDHLLP